MLSDTDVYSSFALKACEASQKHVPSSLKEWQDSSEEELDGSFPDIERDDMLARRFGTFQKSANPVRTCCPPLSVVNHRPLKQPGNNALWGDWKTPPKTERSETGNQHLCAASARFACNANCALLFYFLTRTEKRNTKLIPANKKIAGCHHLMKNNNKYN